jgi:hypothetical protein
VEQGLLELSLRRPGAYQVRHGGETEFSLDFDCKIGGSLARGAGRTAGNRNEPRLNRLQPFDRPEERSATGFILRCEEFER